jgi:signal peptidase II
VRDVQAARGTALSRSEPDKPTARIRGDAERPRTLLIVAIAAAVVLVDQIAKAIMVATVEGRAPVVIVDGWLQLRVLRNFGAAFSTGTDLPWVFTLFAIVVIAIVVRLSRRSVSTPWAVVLALLLGGAVGNLIDRVLRSRMDGSHPGLGFGGVVDFVDVPWFAVFNVADASLTVAACAVAVLALRQVPMTPPPPAVRED